MKVDYEEKTVATQRLETSQMKTIRCDDRHIDFDEQRINEALIKTKRRTHGSLSPLIYEKIQVITNLVVQEIESWFAESVRIHEARNIVEHILLERSEYKLAEEYINYRAKRDFAHSKATNINFPIERLVNKDRAVMNEDANKDSNALNTQRDLTAGIVGRPIGPKILPPHIASTYQRGDIHCHDLDYHPYIPMTNCHLIGFKDVLNNGLKVDNAEVESPKSIQTTTARTSQITTNVTSSQYGGCSVD